MFDAKADAPESNLRPPWRGPRPVFHTITFVLALLFFVALVLIGGSFRNYPVLMSAAFAVLMAMTFLNVLLARERRRVLGLLASGLMFGIALFQLWRALVR